MATRSRSVWRSGGQRSRPCCSQSERCRAPSSASRWDCCGREFMRVFGDVIGLPFALEGIAFFLEAIFLGIYLYGWDRMPPRQHRAVLIPIARLGCRRYVLHPGGELVDELAERISHRRRQGHRRRSMGGDVQPCGLAAVPAHVDCNGHGRRLPRCRGARDPAFCAVATIVITDSALLCRSPSRQSPRSPSPWSAIWLVCALRLRNRRSWRRWNWRLTPSDGRPSPLAA